MRVVVSIWLIVGCLLSLPAMADHINWTGCGISKKAYIHAAAKAFEEKRGIKVNVSGGGATKGIRAVASGASDVGGSCRLWLYEVDGRRHRDEANTEFVHVAWDAIVPIANKRNTVTNISMDNLKKVFAGEITNWQDLGGEDRRIGLVTRSGKTSGVGYMFRKLALGDVNADYKAKGLEVKSTGPLEKRVVQFNTAFAVDGISSAKKVDVELMAIDGIIPTKENISSGKYPLYRPLFLTLKKSNSNPIAREFVDFILSDEGQAIISNQGTVNLKEGEKLVSLWQERGFTL
ncbi:MAG: phosphate ABC transporter substrate-binding protein [Moraxellaceae bacterium]|nr:MAG: phosphate ABC transporter substrate-binding protein [Moraxellaceae bacterium]